MDINRHFIEIYMMNTKYKKELMLSASTGQNKNHTMINPYIKNNTDILDNITDTIVKMYMFFNIQ